MSRVLKEDQADFATLSGKPYKDQAVWFLNGFWDEFGGQAEKIWKFVECFVALDPERTNGHDLDEFWSHKFLEGLGETMTAIELRERLRQIDVDNNKRMSLIEYLIFSFSKSAHDVLTAPQGSNKEEMDAAQAMVDAAQAALDEVMRRLEEQRQVEAPFKKADEENKAALAELQAQEDAYKSKIAELEGKMQTGGTVARNRAANELEQLKAQDPLPLARAKLNQAASCKKAEKARAPFLEATQRVEAAVADAETKFRQASECLEEVKRKGGVPRGRIWWMEREMEEKRKYLPGYKPNKAHDAPAPPELRAPPVVLGLLCVTGSLETRFEPVGETRVADGHALPDLVHQLESHAVPELGVELSEEPWDLAWVNKEWMLETFNSGGAPRLREWQRVNHFPNFYEISRKDLLWKNLKRARRTPDVHGNRPDPAAYDFLPQSYYMPREYALFAEEFKRTPGALWIMKPIGGSQGKGIFLVQTLSQVAPWRRASLLRGKGVLPTSASEVAEEYVVQRYIERPLLIGGKKFDLRLYTLVLSYTPLVAYIYRSGFARFSHYRYSTDSATVGNAYVHLTNVAKHSEAYTGRCKWEVSNVRKYVLSAYGPQAAASLFDDIQATIVRSLVVAQPVIIQDRHCFELYGYDVLIDSAMKPWILEVNSCPSMTAENDEDRRLKSALLHDTLDLVYLWRPDPSPGHSPGQQQAPEHYGGFDLVYFDRKPTAKASFIGCANPRVVPRVHPE
eukprot:m51a1_g439 hypothetical protein (736) ;mRNA; r:71195-76891